MVLDERAGVFPITESDSETNISISSIRSQGQSSLPVMIWATPEVKDDSEDNEAHDGDNFNGAVTSCDNRYRSIRSI